jgi:release factor glutamine methyltransferase
MRLYVPPGVHRPCSDAWMLAEAMRDCGLAGASVADVCTGSGVLAIFAARAHARRVLATDISRRALLATRLNAAANGCSVHVRRGALLAALRGERFDLLVSNPPYVPAATDELPRHRRTTALDGGRSGRALIDPICRDASRHLRPGGSLLVVHSSICGEQQTCALLERSGLRANVHSRHRGGLGPVLRSRAAMLRARGLLGEADEDELLVIRGRMPT